METKVKMGWGALRIIGIIYTGLGGLFLALGLFLWWALPDEAQLVGKIFTPIGGLFFILGIMFLTFEHRKKRRAEKLIEAGRYVWAQVTDCEPNYNVRVNRRHPYRLVASYTDGRGTTHLFKSRDLFIDGATGLVGRSVKVYADGDFLSYYVDTEPLAANYIEH